MIWDTLRTLADVGNNRREPSCDRRVRRASDPEVKRWYSLAFMSRTL